LTLAGLGTVSVKAMEAEALEENPVRHRTVGLILGRDRPLIYLPISVLVCVINQCVEMYDSLHQSHTVISFAIIFEAVCLQ